MLVQISSGMGPVECELAVKKMLQYFIKHNDVHIIETHESRFSDGYTSVIFETGDDLSEYNGTVQWIFQSPIRKGHKRKNWFINVSILNEVEEFVYENNDVYFEPFHCGGNGGQNVNKVETGVRATHIATGITVTSTKERSQLLNKKDCIRKIKLILEQSKQQSIAHHKNDAWKEHNNLIRGNPVKTFKE